MKITPHHWKCWGSMNKNSMYCHLLSRTWSEVPPNFRMTSNGHRGIFQCMHDILYTCSLKVVVYYICCGACVFVTFFIRCMDSICEPVLLKDLLCSLSFILTFSVNTGLALLIFLGVEYYYVHCARAFSKDCLQSSHIYVCRLAWLDSQLTWP
jgi:hypothetical protein